MTIANIDCFGSLKWVVLGKDILVLKTTSIACNTKYVFVRSFIHSFIRSFLQFAPRKHTEPKPEISIQVLKCFI